MKMTELAEGLQIKEVDSDISPMFGKPGKGSYQKNIVCVFYKTSKNVQQNK